MSGKYLVIIVKDLNLNKGISMTKNTTKKSKEMKSQTIKSAENSIKNVKQTIKSANKYWENTEYESLAEKKYIASWKSLPVLSNSIKDAIHETFKLQNKNPKVFALLITAVHTTIITYLKGSKDVWINAVFDYHDTY